MHEIETQRFTNNFLRFYVLIHFLDKEVLDMKCFIFTNNNLLKTKLKIFYRKQQYLQAPTTNISV